MINSITIRNFKCLRDVQLSLEPFTVFVGPNASGKSSILQALSLLCRAFRGRNGNIEEECKQRLSRNATEPVELMAKLNEVRYRYRAPLPPGSPKAVSFKPKAGDGREIEYEIESEDWKPWKTEAKDKEQPAFPQALLLRLESSHLVSQQPTQDPTKMEPDGKGMHSALASMALNEPDTWVQLQADLTRIIPSIRRLRHTKQPQVSLLFDTMGADGLSANQVSEGTLLVLGLLTAIYSTESPSLVLLDDLDRGLHPKAQKDLVDLLRGLLAARPDLQIVATTHSPYLLDCMEPQEVRLTYLNDEGSTRCDTLTGHPKFQTWKDEMHSGELWSLFGEQWVADKGAST